MTDHPPHSPESKPQVRTLLLTDLCESTTLVERLGDALAAALFREHDRLVLELQQRWRGRLIDRSDGLLLLFERPIDGLGFALDYMRGLHDLGQARKLKLQARAGLHVGEVLTWHNSDEAVRAGAKSLEVEGLAKPLAGRLMSLARPGQILLSAVAEPMSHRAASELGERGQHLVWKSYGRWRFKGVPTAQEIHEVGEPGLAALRMPKHTAKAWRDIPLWRRPIALAAEIGLVAVLGTGAWFLTRSPPAIAFNERDWVVVGDLRNLTGQPVLDESLEQAFRISLEQSRYVNVLSDLKVRDTLALMKRKPEEPLDRATASEVALRDGARAVILPTVAEVGGRVRVSAEVIDPHTQTTVYAQSADGTGAASALDSIDKVTGELRNQLGEAVDAIERDSAPLPKVTTGNIDALKIYALGNHERASGDRKKALAYYQRAVDLDPNFALAILAAGQMQATLGDLPAARREFDRAAKLREHLSGRETLLLDANIAKFGPIEPLLQRWQQMVALYPDSFNAQFALAFDGMNFANKYAEGLPHAKAASVPQNERQGMAIYLQGILLLGMDKYAEAIRAFNASRETAFKGAVYQFAYAYAAQHDWNNVEKLLKQRAEAGVASADLDIPYNDMLFSVDRGRWLQAEKAAKAMLEASENAEPLLAPLKGRVNLLAVKILAGREPMAGLERQVIAEIAAVDRQADELNAIYPRYADIYRLALGYWGSRMESLGIVERALASMKGAHEFDGYPPLAQMHQVLLADRDRLRGNPKLAVARLENISRQDAAVVPLHRSLMVAAIADGKTATALREAEWLSAHRGRAYVEQGADGLPAVFNIADTTLAQLTAAELYDQLGRKDEARESLARFLKAWPESELPEKELRRAKAVSSYSARSGLGQSK